MDKGPLQEPSKLSKRPENPKFGGFYNMYYAIDVSVLSLHRESTDSLITKYGST